jgi:protein involved in ribonucleotide reduction
LLVVYNSMTGNVRRFTNKLSMKSVRVEDELVMDEPFVLITYTFGFGNPPEAAMNFLQSNHTYLKAVAASGNRNWGDHFARSADVISAKYGVPVALKFELSGTDKDAEIFTERVQQIGTH